MLCIKINFEILSSSYVISSEGWEQLGLYEFFKAKAQAKRQKGLPEDRDFNPVNDFSCSQEFPEKKDEKRRRYRELKRFVKIAKMIDGLCREMK